MKESGFVKILPPESMYYYINDNWYQNALESVLIAATIAFVVYAIKVALE